jgi:hypothetical protein
VYDASPVAIEGQLLAGNDPANYTVTFGGVAGAVSSNVTVNNSMVSFEVTPPALPSGHWPVEVLVAGFGRAGPVNTESSSDLSVK